MPLPFAWHLMLQLAEFYWSPFGSFTIETAPDYVAVLWQPSRFR